MYKQRRQKQMPGNLCQIFDSNGEKLCSQFSSTCGTSSGVIGAVSCNITPGQSGALSAQQLSDMGLKEGDACSATVEGAPTDGKYTGVFTSVGGEYTCKLN